MMDMSTVVKTLLFVAIGFIGMPGTFVVKGTTVTPEKTKLIVVTSDSAIYKSEGNDLEFQRVPIKGDGRPYGIDVDLDLGMMFWTDARYHQIQRARVDGSDFAVVETSSSSTSSTTGPRGIAIDPNEAEIYWTDSASRSIEMVRYDGTGRRRVTSLSSSYSTLPYPVSLVLDKERRYLYWHHGGYMKRCLCDCVSVENVHHTGITSSTYHVGLAFDAIAQRLYWSYINHLQSYLRTSGSTSSLYTFPSRRTLAYGIAWFEDDLYVTTSDSNMPVGVIDAGDYRGIAVPGLSNPHDIFVGRLRLIDPNMMSCNFEQTSGCWKHWLGSHEWKWSDGRSDEGALTPSVDHSTSTASGRYMVMSTANHSHSAGDVFTLSGPRVNASGSPTNCFRFWYYMHHVNGGYLKVFFQPDAAGTNLLPLWSAFGEQPAKWIGAQVEVPASSVGKLVIKAIVTDPTLFVVAVDDVEFGPCRESITDQA